MINPLDELSQVYLNQISEECGKDGCSCNKEGKKCECPEGCKKCGCNLKEENNLEEMHGGTMSKLGPREKGRKDKGKKKPQAIRQAKARTKALKQKLNAEGFSDWRQDLREVIDKDVAPQKDPMKDTEDKEIKDKKVNNKVVMNPPMKEAFVIEEVDFPVEQIYGFLISEGYVENLFEAEDLIENATDDELADLLMEAMNRIVPGPKSAEHELKKEKDKRTKAAFALSDKEKEAAAKRRKGMEDKANLERSVKKPDAEPAHKGYYSRMKGGLEKTFKKTSATHPAMKKEEKNPALDMVRRSMGKALIDTKNQPKRQHWSKEHMRKDTDPKRYDKKND